MTKFKTEHIDTPMNPHEDPYLALANLFLRWLGCDDKQKAYDLLVKFRVAMEQMEKAVPSMRKDLRVLESHMFLGNREQATTLWPEIEFELLERWEPKSDDQPNKKTRDDQWIQVKRLGDLTCPRETAGTWADDTRRNDITRKPKPAGGRYWYFVNRDHAKQLFKKSAWPEYGLSD